MKLFAAVATALAACIVAQAASAQSYPAKPIRVVVPFPPGGAADTLLRPLSVKLGELLTQQIVADPRPGANGNIAAEIVARAPADGYTLLFANSSLPISMSLYDKLPFDAVKDFTPVSLVALTPSVLVVHPSLPVRSVKDLIALAKKQPGKLNFASGGVGNTMHLAAELLDTMAGIRMTHVPYKGAGPAIVDVIGGQCDLVFVNIAPVLAHIRAGKVIAIAVTSRNRAAVLPEVPTVAESGMPGYESTTWYGFLGPTALPRDIVIRLNGAIVAAVGAREMRERYVALGSDPETSTPEQFAAYLRNDIVNWSKVVKASGAKAE
ncbi:MAG TPA: tripartite tricarboxylate transporter substrate binding protein [Burkholderiales bacterium]|nr:tripartite tricarboxylate transporter substrate binding protein [Burkholderiales bacterium]